VSVRRRFTDFVFLFKQLSRDFPAAAVPPLPDKQRMEYVRGDRFGGDFTARRAHSLQRFLRRLALHPTLRRAPILHVFLESPDWNATVRSRSTRASLASDGGSGGGGGGGGGGSGVFDNFADTFINAFTKVHKPDRRFIEVKDKSDKLDEDLGHIEKVVARRPAPYLACLNHPLCCRGRRPPSYLGALEHRCGSRPQDFDRRSPLAWRRSHLCWA